MTVGLRIKKRRKELKLSVDQVAEQLGKNRATVYRYESDEIEDMSINIISDLARILKIDPGYLMGWKESKEDLVSKNSYTYLPTSISAGLPIEVEGITENDTEEIILPDAVLGKWAGRKDVFFTKINGDSMNRVMQDGSIIAVKKTSQEDLSNGDIVVFSKDHEYGVKKFYKFEDRILFKPDSSDPSFTDQEIKTQDAADLIIHGKVVLYIVEKD